jgi:hypothetical protein
LLVSNNFVSYGLDIFITLRIAIAVNNNCKARNKDFKHIHSTKSSIRD